MLSSYCFNQNEPIPQPSGQVNYQRNLKDDLKTALDLLFEFKEKIDKLHPNTKEIIEQMLQKRSHF